MQRFHYDVVVVGGGILGTATARELLLRNQSLKLAIVEKERDLALHQSGHNSGVVHSGIYYTPGSLKAKLCVEGLKLTYSYCDLKQIPYKKCGKLIVAVKKEELSRLHTLFEKGKENGVTDLILIKPSEIKQIEPNCQGLEAIWSPNTGIVDWAKVNESYGRDCEEKGADVYKNFCVTKFRTVTQSEKEGSNYPIVVCGENKELQCRYAVTCGGLFADKLAVMSGCSPEPRIIPFRGEYLQLKPEKKDLVTTNIYPVPDPRLPFLGVHFTPRMDGSIWLGPNAALSFKREGYNRTDISFADLWEMATFRGFHRLAMKHTLYGLQQMYEGINISAQVRQLQKYVPKLRRSDVFRGSSGVRAQALGIDGKLVDDFVFDCGKGILGERILHVRNAPSPAATSSLAIAKIIADKVEQKFSLSSSTFS